MNDFEFLLKAKQITKVRPQGMRIILKTSFQDSDFGDISVELLGNNGNPIKRIYTNRISCLGVYQEDYRVAGPAEGLFRPEAHFLIPLFTSENRLENYEEYIINFRKFVDKGIHKLINLEEDLDPTDNVYIYWHLELNNIFIKMTSPKERYFNF